MAGDEAGELDRKQTEKILYIAMTGLYLGSGGLKAESDMIIFI